MLMLLVVLCFSFHACEEVKDYGEDLIGVYVLSALEFDGQAYDMSDLPLESTMFVEITKDDVISYENSEDVCEDTYFTETYEIEGVTESAILYTDGTESEYSWVEGDLRIEEDGDVAIFSLYEGSVPPAVWTDPSMVENDNYEPDDDMANATNIAAGGTVQNHYIGACEDLDYFMFAAVSGTSYRLETTTSNDPDLDLTLTLFDASGTILGEDDDSGTDWNPSLIWTCTQSGDYYFVVEGYDFSETGNYAISVTEYSGLLKVEPPTEKQLSFSGSGLSLGDMLFR